MGEGRIVVRTEGRAAGKGVLVTDSLPEAMAYIATLLDTTNDIVVHVRPADEGEVPSG